MRRKREQGRPPADDPKIHLPRYKVRESVLRRFAEYAEGSEYSPSVHLELAILDYLERKRQPRIIS